MAKTYKDYSKKQYKQIPEGELKDGDVFICRADDYYMTHLPSWRYVVARMRDDRLELCGLFKLEFFAKKFACSI